MDGNVNFSRPNYGLDQSQVASPNSISHPERTSNDSNANESRTTRDGSVATAVEENGQNSMDKIETAPSAESHGSGSAAQNDHKFHLTDTFRSATHAAKSKIYLHHRNRNRKDLDKQFTPGSVPNHLKANPDPEAGTDSNNFRPNVFQNILVMFTTFPYWNMAFWSGFCYSIGSALFILCGCFAWVPLQWPNTEFKGEELYGGSIPFFIGALLYQVGGVMAYLEAVNDGCFAGATMKKLLAGHQDIEKQLLDAKLHRFFGHIVPHHHHEDGHDHHRPSNSNDPESALKEVDSGNVPDEMYDDAKDCQQRRGGVDQGSQAHTGQVSQYLTWQWWPTWHQLWHYHIFEMGYVACAIQLFGVTLYGVTAVVVLPGILDTLAWWQELAAYWIPQVIASVCFLVASIMFTMMAGDKWWKPKPGAVSWWIGIHAQIGSVGFLLCAIFGLYSDKHSWAGYESSLSSLWGSFFYMLSGLFQWYEAINVNVGPVLAFPNARTPVLLRKSKN